ncbi:tRNA (guanosine(46)-N7)-methyltransferase TrmB [Actinotalea sp. JY-7876]|uniref:tRNA (guanosine(46)-N7)-methyltransferase TrmB n=1 Tax=Actinotalea sp. JY-7876 TaxID=2758442 RepID=UPI0015F720D6|nr:tRNA (guanosine(46)-N7)-methyltransferase TrmB [Actinotalea sp. JY-7876]
MSDDFTFGAPEPHGPLRTFHPRRATLGPARREALERLWPTLGFSVHGTGDGPLDRRALFGRDAPLVLEIGSGMGEAVAAMAAADPGRDYLAVEAHLPGIANLLLLVEAAGLTNVRVAHGDALELLRHRVPEGSLDAIHVFFPDPWPKKRHHKRRIVQPDHVALMRSRLAVGGVLHVATDWAPYAEVVLEVLAADPGLENPHGGPAPRPAHRPVTSFERRGLDLGHEITDVVVRRVA